MAGRLEIRSDLVVQPRTASARPDREQMRQELRDPASKMTLRIKVRHRMAPAAPPAPGPEGAQKVNFRAARIRHLSLRSGPGETRRATPPMTGHVRPPLRCQVPRPPMVPMKGQYSVTRQASVSQVSTRIVDRAIARLRPTAPHLRQPLAVTLDRAPYRSAATGTVTQCMPSVRGTTLDSSVAG
jgi:hypothetical protein